MRIHNRIALSLLAIAGLLSMPFTSANADGDNCCGGMGGVQYCDTSAGHQVCKNGDYSACYCTRHAVMNLEKIAGCCLWHAGVFIKNRRGLVVCHDGSVSEICGLETPEQHVAQ